MPAGLGVEVEGTVQDVGEEFTVVLVEALELEEGGCLGVGLHVLASVGGKESFPIPSQTGLGGVVLFQSGADALGGGDRRGDRQVHASHGQTSVESEPGGV